MPSHEPLARTFHAHSETHDFASGERRINGGGQRVNPLASQSSEQAETGEPNNPYGRIIALVFWVSASLYSGEFSAA